MRNARELPHSMRSREVDPSLAKKIVWLSWVLMLKRFSDATLIATKTKRKLKSDDEIEINKIFTIVQLENLVNVT